MVLGVWSGIGRREFLAAGLLIQAGIAKPEFPAPYPHHRHSAPRFPLCPNRHFCHSAKLCAFAPLRENNSDKVVEGFSPFFPLISMFDIREERAEARDYIA
jgi:hypothetical protein